MQTPASSHSLREEQTSSNIICISQALRSIPLWDKSKKRKNINHITFLPSYSLPCPSHSLPLSTHPTTHFNSSTLPCCLATSHTLPRPPTSTTAVTRITNTPATITITCSMSVYTTARTPP
ncbi:hypothetical protein E2C01_073333 [Portunus trituberculatus]|uniref:Uncharacterized protein n=1 Tax=Portunus trituberculatus TaxID=210409 RepID=A0A5B7IDP6_PORTR|nr:hypothetical protein [Portunus trituberculatus]